MDPAAALDSAQIARQLLDNPEARITAQQMETCAGHAMRELNDESLGWFSRKMPFGASGMLCRASLPSGDLKIALKRWCRHHGYLIDDIRLELAVYGRSASLVIHEDADLGVQREFCFVSMLRNIHGIACWLADSGIPLEKAAFPFSEPRHAEAYPLMFRCPVMFAAPRASITFDADYLKLPVRRNDDDLRQMLLRPLPLIVLQYRRDRLLSKRVQMLLRDAGFAFATADDLADKLNISTRSLHRHLADEGFSLQRLRDEARREVAIEHLTRSTKSLKQVAFHAGFRSEASFIRAFRSWTGMTPGEFRASLSIP